MSELLGQLAMLCTAAGVVAGAIAAVSTRRPLAALRLAVDFWLAAGLLRLSGDPTWRSIGAAACIIVVRRMVSRGLRHTD